MKSNFSKIQDEISNQKYDLRKESCRNYDVKCENFWCLYTIDENGQRNEGGYELGEEGPISKKKILNNIAGLPEVKRFMIEGNAYSLDRDLSVMERWEHKDLFGGWVVEIDRELNIINP